MAQAYAEQHTIQSGNNTYTISKTYDGHYQCSCKGWIFHNHGNKAFMCKHIKEFLAGNLTPTKIRFYEDIAGDFTVMDDITFDWIHIVPDKNLISICIGKGLKPTSIITPSDVPDATLEFTKRQFAAFIKKCYAAWKAIE